MKYYVLLDNEPKGPFPLAMVREMLSAGTIQEMTLVAPEGGHEWVPAGPFLAGNPSGIEDSGNVKQGPSAISLITCRKWVATRKAPLAAVVIVGLGIWIYRGVDERGSHKEPTSGSRAGRNSHYEPDRGSRNVRYGAQGSLREEVRKILSQRYPGQPELQREIESGVMKLSETFPNDSATTLVRTFEKIATGY